MTDSVHDNWLYAQAADHERCRIVLHTVYPHIEPAEYTDVVFEGVVVHHFEQQAFSGGAVPANVLFDVLEAPARETLAEYSALLERHRNYAWPVLKWIDLNDLVAQLMQDGVKCYRVESSCGLDGFVFATSMVLRSRPSRAEVIG